MTARSRLRAGRTRAWALAALTVLLAGCATLQQLAALRDVDFSVDRVSGVRLAGIDLTGVRSYSDLGITDAGRLALAVSQRDLPMDFRVHLTALNPEDNSVDARLVRLDWTLFLQGRETLSGVFADETLLPRGQPTDVPISVSLDLIDFFEGSARDLLDLALAVSGQGGAPTEVTLRAVPTVDTALGPIRYPQPITIVSREVGR
ncbi:MAG TPA: LEA type 2 family protein [Longimicrobiales bacterium]|nr:LEA type 2 family protein [Longimicrobiales bacterium]